MFYIVTGIGIALTLIIVMQPRGATLGSMSGAGDEVLPERRGAEAFIHRLTILIVMLFIGLSIAYMLVPASYRMLPATPIVDTTTTTDTATTDTATTDTTTTDTATTDTPTNNENSL